MRPEGINDLHIMWAIRDLPNINFIHKGILWGFLSIIGNKDSCLYSKTELAQVLGCSRRYLFQLFPLLLKSNYLIEKKPNINGRGFRSEYLLNYQKILTDSGKGAQCAPISDPERVHNVHQLSKIKGAQCAPSLLREPLKEKRVRAKRAPLPVDFYLTKEGIKLGEETAKKTGKNLNDLFTKFKNVAKSKDKVSSDWDAEWENFLINERPSGLTQQLQSQSQPKPPYHRTFEENKAETDAISKAYREKEKKEMQNLQGKEPLEFNGYQEFKALLKERRKMNGKSEHGGSDATVPNLAALRTDDGKN